MDLKEEIQLLEDLREAIDGYLRLGHAPSITAGRSFQNLANVERFNAAAKADPILVGYRRRISQMKPQATAIMQGHGGYSIPFLDVVPENQTTDDIDKHRILDEIDYAIGTLKSLAPGRPVEEPSVIDRREFTFIRGPEIRAILERDYVEIQQALAARCWKSVIILSGGAIEAILLDLVRRDETKATASTKAPKKESDITHWDLSDLIAVCVDQKLIGLYVSTVSEATRQCRNLIHPGNEVRTKLTFAEEEAKIAVTVLQAIHRDLSR